MKHQSDKSDINWFVLDKNSLKKYKKRKEEYRTFG